MKKLWVVVVLLSTMGAACRKDANRKLLNAYFEYTFDNRTVRINDGILLNDHLFSCRVVGDTLLQLMVSKVYDGAGIFIKDAQGLKDSTYQLAMGNYAYVLNPADVKRYSTTSRHTGTVTIKKGTFQAKDLLNTLEGTFSFTATDSTTGKTFQVTNGTFLMEQTVR